MFAVGSKTYLPAMFLVYERSSNGVVTTHKTRPDGLNARGHALALHQRHITITATSTGIPGRLLLAESASCVPGVTQHNQQVPGQDIRTTLCLGALVEPHRSEFLECRRSLLSHFDCQDRSREIAY